MKVVPRVTLVVIAYGQPELLEALLDSIADHTPEAHEILVEKLIEAKAFPLYLMEKLFMAIKVTL